MEQSVIFNAGPIRFASRPGIPHWDRLSPSVELLAEVVSTSPNDRWAVLGSGHGGLAAHLAQRCADGQVVACDPSALAQELTASTARLNGLRHLEVSDRLTMLPEGAGQFDCVAIDLPKGRALVRRFLLEAHGLLRPEGALYLAGANDEGIRTALKDAQDLFGPVELLSVKRRNRVARTTRTERSPEPPAWSTAPGIAPGTFHRLEVEWGGVHHSLRSLPGIFSFERLDPGTAFLLEHAPKPTGRGVLDFGCGYGFIGRWAALGGAERVDLTDINAWAAAVARLNLDAVGSARVRVFAGDGLSPLQGTRYGLILANLPFHVGKAVDTHASTEFVDQIARHLEHEGELVFVTNAFIRHDAQLRHRFRYVECIAENRSFRVMRACIVLK